MTTVEVWMWMAQKKKDPPFLIFFFPPEIKADVNRACLGVCKPLRAIKPARVPGRRSR